MWGYRQIARFAITDIIYYRLTAKPIISVTLYYTMDAFIELFVNRLPESLLLLRIQSSDFPLLTRYWYVLEQRQDL